MRILLFEASNPVTCAPRRAMGSDNNPPPHPKSKILRFFRGIEDWCFKLKCDFSTSTIKLILTGLNLCIGLNLPSGFHQSSAIFSNFCISSLFIVLILFI